MSVGGRWTFYGRQEELGTLLQRLRRPRWFFGTIRGRRRIGKTALIQQALTTLREDDPDARRTLLVQLPDSPPPTWRRCSETQSGEAGLEAQLDGSRPVRDLPSVAAAVGALCSAGAIVVLDEFQICLQGPSAACLRSCRCRSTACRIKTAPAD